MLGEVLVPSFPLVSSVKIVVSCSYLAVKDVVVRVLLVSYFLRVTSIMISVLFVVV